MRFTIAIIILALLDLLAFLAGLEHLITPGIPTTWTERRLTQTTVSSPRANSVTLAEVVLQLIGDKEEGDDAAQMRKIFKGGNSSRRSTTEPFSDFWERSHRGHRQEPFLEQLLVCL